RRLARGSSARPSSSSTARASGAPTVSTRSSAGLPPEAGSGAMTLDLDVGNGIRLTYATPVLMRNVAGAERMNERLRKLILAREAADTRPRKGKHNSGVGGWRTGPDFLNWPDPEIAWLRTEFGAGLDAIIQLAVPGHQNKRADGQTAVSAGANVNR